MFGGTLKCLNRDCGGTDDRDGTNDGIGKLYNWGI